MGSLVSLERKSPGIPLRQAGLTPDHGNKVNEADEVFGFLEHVKVKYAGAPRWLGPLSL